MERLCQSLKNKIMTPEQAAALIKSGMCVGMSGFGVVGYPKLVPEALSRMKNAAQLKVFTGATPGPEVDDAMVEAGLVSCRAPYQGSKRLRDAVNNEEVSYLDMHLSHLPTHLNRWGNMVDVAVIECAAVTEEGLIPTTAVGCSNVFVSQAKQVIVELNTTVPIEIYGLHDIYTASLPSDPRPIPLCRPMDRIGKPYIPCPMEKIAGVVFSERPDACSAMKPADDASKSIAGHIVEFLRSEIRAGRLPANLNPIQSGVGSVANAVLAGLHSAGFTGVKMFTEVLQDSALRMIQDGIIDGASTCALALTRQGMNEFLANVEKYKSKVVLRPQEISNSPELARRMGLVSMNTPVEFDIYGNVNSTHIMGTHVINGIGGSGDFARNAGLTIFATSSVAKNGAISCVVPMVSHVDHTEHDTQIFVTEQGLADLRWKAPIQRAEEIIEKCAHPDYRPMLQDYLERAKKESCGHTPHILREALSWHVRYKETGSMRG